MADKKDGGYAPLNGLVVHAARGEVSKLAAYLSSNSHLPGPRANLELLAAFSTSIRKSKVEPNQLWKLCFELRESADEFVAMCGVRGMGAIGVTNPQAFGKRSISELRASASSPNWRVREAVAMAVQDLLESNPGTIDELQEWIRSGDCLQMRAVAAGVAEPRLLKSDKVARSALRVHQSIFRALNNAERRSGEFKVLRQALAYSLSVVVAALPEEGFEYMQTLVAKGDPDILWICRENLKKNRLASHFPREVKALSAMANRWTVA